jgi:hypothetical protein
MEEIKLLTTPPVRNGKFIGCISEAKVDAAYAKPAAVTLAPSSTVLEARNVQLNPFRRQGADLEALKAEIRVNIEANPRAKRIASKKFNGLEMATAGRQVSFIRGSQAITFFIREGGAVVILSEPKHRAFFPEMERHINATVALLAAKINSPVAA